jgi:hypothetical protein
VNRVFVDTSAWYAYVRANDPDHARVEAPLEAPGRLLVTSNFVFDELVTLVRLRLGHSTAVRVGKTLREGDRLELIRILPEDEERAWSLVTGRKDKNYSFTDCTSFALMRRLGIETAVATDRHSRQAGFRQEP